MSKTEPLCAEVGGVRWWDSRKNPESLIPDALPSLLRTNVLYNPAGGRRVLQRELNL